MLQLRIRLLRVIGLGVEPLDAWWLIPSPTLISLWPEAGRGGCTGRSSARPRRAQRGPAGPLSDVLAGSDSELPPPSPC